MSEQPRDVRLDLELRVDEEIDRQLDTRIAWLYARSLANIQYSLSYECVSYKFVPERLDVPRGIFDERCVARGFRRECDQWGNVWMRGTEGMFWTSDETDRITSETQRKLIEQFVAESTSTISIETQPTQPTPPQWRLNLDDDVGALPADLSPDGRRAREG